MKNCQATWEDEENNRHVELVVNYRLDDTRVEINHVTPTRVTFLCPTSGSPVRSIGVRTGGGRRLLARLVEESGHFDTLKQHIAEGRVVEIDHHIDQAPATPAPAIVA